MTEKIRVDEWVRRPSTADQLLEFLGKHLVAYPDGRSEDRAGGHCIALNPETQTVSLRRYDNGAVREFPWSTTDFRHTTEIDSPFMDLEVSDIRRFDWFYAADGSPVTEPIILVGVVDLVKPDAVVLWVRDAAYDGGGWWASLKAEDAAKHSLRLVQLIKDAE